MNYRQGMIVTKKPEHMQPPFWQIEAILEDGRYHLRTLANDRIATKEEMDAVFMVTGEANFQIGGGNE